MKKKLVTLLLVGTFVAAADSQESETINLSTSAGELVYKKHEVSTNYGRHITRTDFKP